MQHVALYGNEVNLLLLEERDFIAAGRVRIAGRRFDQLRQVWRAEAGSVRRVGLLGGNTGTARVAALGETEAELEVVLDTPPPPPLPVTLVAALPRPKTLAKLLHCSVSMGVKHIILLESWKVEKSYWATPLLAPEALRESAMLALEQSCDTIPPRIELRRRFKPFVEDELAAVAAGTRLLVGHPAAAAPFPRRPERPVTLLIGPEGGFTEYEIGLLQTHGAEAVNFGSRPLRTEFALAAMLGAFEFRR